MMTMLLGGLWHGASWNFVLWGFVHGVLLILHRLFVKLRIVKSSFEKIPRISTLVGWIVTQYFVFMTWLIFRVEDTDVLIPSLKTFVGINANWNTQEFLDSLPEIKYLTFGLAMLFFVGHLLSWKLGGFKLWIAKQNSVVWGLTMGTLASLAFLLRPAETVDFIYFRF